MGDSFLLEISEEAKYDIFDAFLWYEEQREGLGLDFELCLEAGLYTLNKHPLLFEEKYQNVRIHFIERFPYGIHYLIYRNEIKVVGVFHTSRNPNDWFERIKF